MSGEHIFHLIVETEIFKKKRDKYILERSKTTNGKERGKI